MDRGGYSPGPAGRKAAASVKTPSGRNGAGASQPAQLRPNGAFFKHIFFNALMARVTPSSGEGSNGKGTKASYDALWKIAKEEGEGLQSQLAERGAPAKEMAVGAGPSKSLTYGEVIEESIEEDVLPALRLTKGSKFADLGSGTSKIPLQVALCAEDYLVPGSTSASSGSSSSSSSGASLSAEDGDEEGCTADGPVIASVGIEYALSRHQLADKWISLLKETSEQELFNLLVKTMKQARHVTKTWPCCQDPTCCKDAPHFTTPVSSSRSTPNSRENLIRAAVEAAEADYPESRDEELARVVVSRVKRAIPAVTAIHNSFLTEDLSSFSHFFINNTVFEPALSLALFNALKPLRNLRTIITLRPICYRHSQRRCAAEGNLCCQYELPILSTCRPTWDSKTTLYVYHKREEVLAGATGSSGAGDELDFSFSFGSSTSLVSSPSHGRGAAAGASAAAAATPTSAGRRKKPSAASASSKKPEPETILVGEEDDDEDDNNNASSLSSSSRKVKAPPSINRVTGAAAGKQAGSLSSSALSTAADDSFFAASSASSASRATGVPSSAGRQNLSGHKRTIPASSSSSRGAAAGGAGMVMPRDLSPVRSTSSDDEEANPSSSSSSSSSSARRPSPNKRARRAVEEESSDLDEERQLLSTPGRGTAGAGAGAGLGALLNSPVRPPSGRRVPQGVAAHGPASAAISKLLNTPGSESSSEDEGLTIPTVSAGKRALASASAPAPAGLMSPPRPARSSGAAAGGSSAAAVGLATPQQQMSSAAALLGSATTATIRQSPSYYTNRRSPKHPSSSSSLAVVDGGSIRALPAGLAAKLGTTNDANNSKGAAPEDEDDGHGDDDEGAVVVIEDGGDDAAPPSSSGKKGSAGAGGAGGALACPPKPRRQSSINLKMALQQ